MGQNAEIVQAAIDYLEERIEGEADLEGASRAAGLSPSHLCMLFPVWTGTTPMEYLRLRRLARAAIELKRGDERVLDVALKYGYESQESFTKAFKRCFGLTPGECRRSGEALELAGRKDVLKDFLHRASHEIARESGAIEREIDVFKVEKPAHRWIAARNRDGRRDFYETAEKSGFMAAINALPRALRYGGAWLDPRGKDFIFGLSYGVEVPADWEGEIPEDCEALDVPASTYIVFNHPPYPPEDHGDVTSSGWKALGSYDPRSDGFAWRDPSFPVYESDDAGGYTLMRAALPVRASRPAS